MKSWRRSFWAPIVALALAVAFALLVASGCGNDEAEVRAAVEQLQAAFDDRDWHRACDLLTVPAQRHIGWSGHKEPSTCVRDLRDTGPAIAEARLFATERGSPGVPQTIAVTVDGDTAVATLTAERGARLDVPLRREDGRWRVHAFYGDIPADEQRERFP